MILEFLNSKFCKNKKGQTEQSAWLFYVLGSESIGIGIEFDAPGKLQAC